MVMNSMIGQRFKFRALNPRLQWWRNHRSVTPFLLHEDDPRLSTQVRDDSEQVSVTDNQLDSLENEQTHSESISSDPSIPSPASELGPNGILKLHQDQTIFGFRMKIGTRMENAFRTEIDFRMKSKYSYRWPPSVGYIELSPSNLECLRLAKAV